jgi:hypothetical protein
MRHAPVAVRLQVPFAIAAGLFAATSWARAGSFEPDGSFVWDQASSFTEGFESFELESDGGAEQFELVEASDALQGSWLLRVLGESNQSSSLALTLPEAQRSYRASIWIRGVGTPSVSVSYPDGTPGESAPLFPTGRVTSDDWYELQSAGFDVDGARGARVALSLRGAFELDALELREEPGRPYRGPRRCLGAADPICGQDSTCIAEWCRNSGALMPPVPQGEQREQLSKYLQTRLQFFFGPYENRRADLPAAIAELQATGTSDSRWQFWNGFATAVHRLQDWHSSTSARGWYSLRSRKPLNVCFFEGVADLSQQLAPSHPALPDLLVAYTGEPEHTWGLKQGDRLVAVDGMHPLEWMRSLISYDWSYHAANDPKTLSDFAAAVRSSIPLYARNITVVRCSASECGAPEFIEVAEVPEVPAGTEVNGVACDQRPTYIVPGGPANHSVGGGALGGLVQGTSDDEKIYGMVWNYLLGQGQNDIEIKKHVATWKNARGVILDHRAGYGGTLKGPEPIIAFVRPPSLMLVDIWRAYNDDEGPQTPAEGLALVSQYKKWGSGWVPGSTQASTDVPVALMITLDGSASDYFPFAMKGAPKVRIFGPHGTVGAFSSFMSLNYWGAIGYQVACEDTLSAQGEALSAHGVEPDEVVWPKQSDLVLGKDTLAERALAWVRAELKP